MTQRMTHVERRERRRQIAEAVAAGMTLGEAARSFGVGTRTAYGACVEYSVRSSPDSAARRHAIADAVADRKDVAAVARDFGVSISLVAASCRECGVPSPARRGGDQFRSTRGGTC